MDKKRVCSILLLIYLTVVKAKDLSSMQTISSDISTGTSSSISGRFIEHSRALTSVGGTPTPSLSWTMLTKTWEMPSKIETRSYETSNFDQSSIAKSAIAPTVGNSASSSASITFSNPSIPFYISPSIEQRKPSMGIHTVANSSKLKEYLSTSLASDAFSSSIQHKIYSQIVQRSNIQHNILSNSSLFSPSISAVSQSGVNSFISKSSVELLGIHLVSSVSSSLQALAMQGASTLSSILQNFPHTTTLITNSNITPSLQSSQMNATQRVQYGTTQSQHIFTSLSSESNNISLVGMDSSYHNAYPDLISVSPSLITSSHLEVQSTQMIHSPSAQIMHSDSIIPYGTMAQRHGPTPTSPSKLRSIPSILSFQMNTKNIGYNSMHRTLPSETFIVPLMTPTMKSPLDDVDMEEKRKEDKGFPAWIAIVTSISVFIAILLIVAVAVRFIRWNKDHGDYALWSSNLELQPITSRNAEVLT